MTTAAAVFAAVVFCVSASSISLINDLLEVETDRSYRRDGERPIPAGDLPIPVAAMTAGVLLSTAAIGSAFLPSTFRLALFIYYVLAVGYSFTLKGIVLLDVMVLAARYTLRIVAGAFAIRVPLSFWMLLFSMLLFLSLAFAKRFAELARLPSEEHPAVPGSGYEAADLPVVRNLGSIAGYGSVLVLALYLNSPEMKALYHWPQAMWLLCLLVLAWISRVWMMTQRGEMHNDPVLSAMTDRFNLGIGALAAVVIAVAM